MNKIICGDCLEEMKNIKSDSIDLILTDPPYGTVNNICKSDNFTHGMKGKTGWDEALNPEDIFIECERILRKNGKAILFSQEPYTSNLITSANKNMPFSYRMVWIKDHFANGLIAKKAPVNYYEDILVFTKIGSGENNEVKEYLREQRYLSELSNYSLYEIMGHKKGSKPQYFDSKQWSMPIRERYDKLISTGFFQKSYDELLIMGKRYEPTFNIANGKKIKSNVFQYKKDYGGLHPTQKPVELLKDLIKTFSNEGDTVLDFTMGSGSTLVACKETNRNGIGIELDEKYFNIAKERIDDAFATESVEAKND